MECANARGGVLVATSVNTASSSHIKAFTTNYPGLSMSLGSPKYPASHAANMAQPKNQERLTQDRVQDKAFTRWVNISLDKSCDHMTNLAGLADGVAIIHLAENLTEKKIKGWTKKPRMDIMKAENINKALKHFNTSFVNIGSDDILAENPTILLGFVWTLILRYQVGHGTDGVDVTWVNQQLEPYDLKVYNFRNGWSDGRVLSALTDSLDPDSFDMDNLGSDHVQITQKAMDVAKENFGIPTILDAEDMVHHPDEHSIMTLVSYYKEAAKIYPKDERKKVRKQAPQVSWAVQGVEKGLAGRAISFSVQPVEGASAPKGVVPTASVKDEGGASIPCVITSKAEGVFEGKYTPESSGEHVLDVEVPKALEVIGTPFKVNVLKPVVMIVGADQRVGASTVRETSATHGTTHRILAVVPDKNTDNALKLGKLSGVEIIQVAPSDFPELVAQCQSHADPVAFLAALVVPSAEDVDGKDGVATVQAIKDGGAQHVVVASATGVDRPGGGQNEKRLLQVEEAAKTSGLSWSILRSPSLLDDVLGQVPSVVNKKKVCGVIKGDTAHGAVLLSDVGDAHKAILSKPTDHVNKTYEISCHPFTGNNLADAFSKKLNKPITYEKVEPDDLAKALAKELKLSEQETHSIAQLEQAMAEGQVPALLGPGAVKGAGTFRKLTSRDPVGIEDFVEQVWSAFDGEEAKGDPEYSDATGRGVEPKIPACLPAPFTIHCRNEFGPIDVGGELSQLSVGVALADGTKIHCEIKDNCDGTYSGAYTPEQPGEYEVTILLDGKAIKGSPYGVRVEKPLILVASAGERLGVTVVRSLSRRHRDRYRVVAAVPDKSVHSVELLSRLPGVEITELSLEEPGKLVEACRAITVPEAFVTAVVVPPATDVDGSVGVAAVQAFKEGKAQHVLLLSVTGVDKPGSGTMGKALLPVEAAVKESAIPWTILRYPLLMDNLLAARTDVINRNTLTSLLKGDIQHGAVALQDVGLAGAELSSDPSPHNGKIYEVGCPAYHNELAAEILTEVLERPIKYAQVDDQQQTRALERLGLSDEAAERDVDLERQVTAGDLSGANDPAAANHAAQTYTQLTGLEPTGLRSFLAAHRELFEGQPEPLAPNCCTASGPGVDEKEAGGFRSPPASLPFVVQLANAHGPLDFGGVPLTAKVIGPDGRKVACEVKDNEDGTFSGAYLPGKPGPYEVSLSINGQPIKGSPFTLDLGQADAGFSYAEGEGVTEPLMVAKEARFTIITCDKRGQRIQSGGDPFKVVITASAKNLPKQSLATVQKAALVAKAQDLQKRLVPSLGMSLGENMEALQVHPTGAAASSGLSEGDVISTLNGATVTSPAEFDTAVMRLTPGQKALVAVMEKGEVEVEVGSAGLPIGETQTVLRAAKGEVHAGDYFLPLFAPAVQAVNKQYEAEAKTSKRRNVPVSLVDNKDGTYTGSYMPELLATYKIDITLHKQPIKEMPKQLKAVQVVLQHDGEGQKAPVQVWLDEGKLWLTPFTQGNQRDLQQMTEDSETTSLSLAGLSNMELGGEDAMFSLVQCPTNTLLLVSDTNEAADPVYLEAPSRPEILRLAEALAVAVKEPGMQGQEEAKLKFGLKHASGYKPVAILVGLDPEEGVALAARFAKAQHGVAVVSYEGERANPLVEAAKEAGAKAAFFKLEDSCDLKQVQQVFAQILKTMGGLTTLVVRTDPNPNLDRKHASLMDIPVDKFFNRFDAATSGFLCAQACLPTFVKNPAGGSILFVQVAPLDPASTCDHASLQSLAADLGSQFRDKGVLASVMTVESAVLSASMDGVEGVPELVLLPSV
eukprot:g71442.t1